MSAVTEDGVQRASAAEAGDRGRDGEERDEDFEEDEEDGFEFGDAEEAMQCVEMAGRSTAAGELRAQAHDYEALAARKRKALAEEQPQREEGSKRPRQDELSEAEAATMFDQLMEGFGLRRKRRSKDGKKRGRKKGTKNKGNPEVIKKLGDATLLFADEKFNEAIPILHEIVRIAPNLPDSYYLLGSIYSETGELDKAINFLMLAAYVSPKDASLWRKLIPLAKKKEDASLARHCILKAMRADPEDVDLKYLCGDMYRNLRDYQKAAEIYEQIVRIYPANIAVRKVAAQMYRECGQIDKAINLLEDYVNTQATNIDWSVLDLLISLYLRKNAVSEALKQIEKARLQLRSQQKLPIQLQAKEVICHAYLGDMKHAEIFLRDVHLEPSKDNADVIKELASNLETMGQYEYAVKFYLMIGNFANHNDGSSYIKVAQCYMVLGDKRNAVPYFYKALQSMKGNIDIRLTLSSLLIDEGKTDEAVTLLSPPKNPELQSANTPDQQKPWWCDGKVKMQLAKIYYDKGKLEDFVDTIFHPILETLNVEYANRKVRPMKKLPNTVLHERVKVLGEPHTDILFNFNRQKAIRAKKIMEKRAASNEESKPDDSRRTKQVPPVPGLLTNMEHHRLVLNVCICSILFFLFYPRYWDALQIINRTLKLGNDVLTGDSKEELRSLGAQIAYRAPDPSHGFKYVRYVVQQHPYSLSAWNSYYKVISRIEDRFPHHFKYLLRTREEKPDCVPPIIISGHRFTAISQHQSAARDYLEAYKLDPENPLINLCVGTALISLALGFRLQNKYQCIVQAFAFLYKYLRLCGDSQEALYNIGRAYHHIGLNTLAAVYYEKALAIEVEDLPIPKLPYEAGSCAQEDLRPGYCDVRREAAFNLHLIYKKSGATDLARRILKTYCTV
ncbi:General transcription factor 3C polypeptide 3 [Dichanthelium oligosanthes]|uniref:General transcription factor 3C polypeptide 3 n=1 Tax=Dichanthelium oligosanthes TaxID=888268 RepID=A0A1E5VGQ5_9POAL|nr:General transcription factor 3C polypeptide 3 [Dichanthelium oligosanthes]